MVAVPGSVHFRRPPRCEHLGKAEVYGAGHSDHIAPASMPLRQWAGGAPGGAMCPGHTAPQGAVSPCPARTLPVFTAPRGGVDGSVRSRAQRPRSSRLNPPGSLGWDSPWWSSVPWSHLPTNER